MKLKTWIETDYKRVQWRVQRVTGVIARILTGRNSYLAFTRLTPLPPDAAAGGCGSREKSGRRRR